MSHLSVRELKKALSERGISFSNIFEKSDLVDLYNEVDAHKPIKMSVSDLRVLIRGFAGKSQTCFEKEDLYLLAKKLLCEKRCLVCLDELLAGREEIVVRLECCSEVLHVSCLSMWLLESVETGKYPHMCPKCAHPINEQFIQKICTYMTATQIAKYTKIVAGLRELHTSPGNGDFDGKKFGLSQCPKCHSWIEKGPAMEAFGIPVAEGCDKMTCRCGCQFCYRCGAIGANCKCTGNEHGFFSHQDVLRDYPDSNINTAGEFFGNLFS